MVDETQAPQGHERKLNEALVAYLNERDSGREPSRIELAERYPDLAEELAEFLDGQEMFDRFSEAMKVPAAHDTATYDAHSTDNLLAPSDSPADEPPPGTRFGEYELTEEIARGGMGIVYKARQVKLDRTVAIKMILAGRFDSQEHQRRFRSEAQAAANLRHANIVAIHDVGQLDGRPYFSMQYVEGRSLADVVREEKLEPRDAARYMATIADAVHYAHEKNTLHRDLKPSNILIDADNQPHITDFGLAKRIDLDAALTTSGATLGTPSYMSPEQALGKADHIGRTTDVYSLGATLYHLLTGQPPFQGATPLETLGQVANSPPTPPRQLNGRLDRDLARICLKCLEKDPAARYQTSHDLADDLRRYLRGEPVKARTIRPVARAARWSMRHPSAAILIFIVLAVSLFGGGAFAYRSFLSYMSMMPWKNDVIPHDIHVENGMLTTRLGDKVTIYYESVTDVHSASRSRGENGTAGGSRVEVTMKGRKVTTRSTVGPSGLSRLTVNGHTVYLTQDGLRLFVDSPEGGGSCYLLENIGGNLMLAVAADGRTRVVHEPPTGPVEGGE